MKSVALCTLLIFACGCKGSPSSDPPTASASPQASAIPAPLAAAPATNAGATTASLTADSGPPPVPMRPDQPAPPDVLAREAAGYTLQATVRTDASPSPRSPDANANAIDSARKENEAHLTIDLAQSRARVVLGRGFAVAENAELRARADHYGYLLLLEPASYRVIAPGALRALFGERRVDVAPLSVADIRGGEEGARRLGVRTRKYEAVTRAATATFEIARIADAGDSGTLLCRMLLDWMGAAPTTPLCGIDDVPLHAEFHWTTHGALMFDATSIVRRLDIAPADLVAPPSQANFVAGPLPPQGADILLTPAELALLHNGPADARGVLKLFNSTDELRFVALDGALVAWVAPGARVELPPITRGRYNVEWRTFFGDSADAPVITAVPGTSETGVLDAGTPEK
ncbi:MAG: hypothetical protein ABI183_05005 [Polyangiaceae bacterium]